MKAIEQALLSFFEQVAKKDKDRLQRLEQERCFRMGEGRWCFTLPDLYSFLQHQDDVFNRIDYKQFRQLIYSCPINQIVKPFGAKITIADNRSMVDESSYALVWRSKG